MRTYSRSATRRGRGQHVDLREVGRVPGARQSGVGQDGGAGQQHLAGLRRAPFGPAYASAERSR
ncbi:hypothetical protein ACFQ0M_17690 [Kitasatospora aburaviensis]